MRRTTWMASLVALAATAAFSQPLPFSAPAPAVAQPPAEPAPEEKAETPEQKPEMEGDKAPEPPAPATEPKPGAAPQPPAERVPPPPQPDPATLPVTEYVSPHQGAYGPLLRLQPAHRLAMLEAGRKLTETDPLVTRVATTLYLLTGQYLEDAPRIVDLTIKTTDAIRKAKGAASPLQLLDLASNLKRPAGSPGVGPRRFEAFADRYRQARVEGGKDHAAAVSELQGQLPPAAKSR